MQANIAESTDDPRQRSASNTNQRLGLAAALTLGAALFSAFIINSLGTVAGRRTFVLFDDAMISMRYARNLADGHGLVWDPGGEAVEGYTNLLWTLWMSLLHVVLPDRLIGGAVILTSAALLLVGVWLSFKLARKLAPRSTFSPVVAAFLTAVCYPLAFWALRGMEVGLISVIFTSTVLIACDLSESPSRNRLIALGVAVSLGLLTRPDTVVVAITTLLVLLVLLDNGRRKGIVIYAVVPLVITSIGLSLFRIGYYDALLPNTYTLKVEGIALFDRLQRGGLTLADLFTRGGIGIVLAFAFIGFMRSWTTRRRQAVLAASAVIAMCAYSIYVGGDAWEHYRFANRYVSAVLPTLFALAGVGLGALFEHRDLQSNNLARSAAFVIATTAGTTVACVGLVRVIDSLGLSNEAQNKYLIAGVIAVVASLLLAAAFRANRSALQAAGIVAVLGTAIATNGHNVSNWNNDVVASGEGDYNWANYGVALREFTTPQATIFVTSAGNISYFLDPKQRVIDGLGKMDPVIAHEAPRSPESPPGHQKWNYERSIRDLRPDVVTQLFRATEHDRDMIVSWGYEPVGDSYVRKDSREVNRDGLKQWLANHPH